MFTHDIGGNQSTSRSLIGNKRRKLGGRSTECNESSVAEKFSSNFYVTTQIGDNHWHNTALNVRAKSWILIEINQYEKLEKVNVKYKLFV